MILERGNMWDVFGNTDLFIVTTNPIRRKDGACVMGRGIALECANRFPDFPFILGEQIRLMELDDQRINAGIVGNFDGQIMGYFMVKEHWQREAKPSIIRKSVNDLLDELVLLSPARVDLNFPGIGNGRLSREEVLPIIEQLPDNVHVWEYGNA